MKKVVSSLAFLLFFSINYCFAIANGILKINLQPEFGIMHGSISEYVFDSLCKNTDNLESRLDWDLKAVPYFKASGDVTIIDIISIKADGKFAIPGDCGYMQDYDWLNSTSPKWISQDPTELTNYSKHTNTLKQYQNFTVGLGGIIPIKDIVYITPLIAYEYSYIHFIGHDGYGKYKSSNFKEYNFSGDVIYYEQETNILKFGIDIKYYPISQLSIISDFYFSPGITYINALDRHLGDFSNQGYPYGKAYLDKLEKGTLIQTSLSAFYNFNDMHKLGLKCSFENLSLVKGNNYMKALDKSKNPDKRDSWRDSKTLGGTSHYFWNWSIIYSLNF